MKMEMYRSLAKYYDLLYSFKDYEKESYEIRDVIEEHKKSPGKKLLDIGCGTGKHLSYLSNWYECTGIDLSKDMLDIAKRKVKGVTFKRMDMMDLRIKDKFDVIVSLFSAIAYVKTYENLEKVLRDIHKMLNYGGVLLFDAWFTLEQLKLGSVHLLTYQSEDGNLKIARVGYPGHRTDFTELEEHYLIAERNKGVMYYVSKEELLIFDRRKTLKLMEEIGFESNIIPDAIGGRDRYIGIRL